MNPKKIDRNVSNMDVLKDIRGLLSTTREDTTTGGTKNENSLTKENSELKTQIKILEEQIQKQREEFQTFKDEKEKITAQLQVPNPTKEKPIDAERRSVRLNEEVAQLEASIAERSRILSEMDNLIKLRSQELLKKMGRLFQDAGQDDVALEFKRGASELDVTENFARFLRVFLDE